MFYLIRYYLLLVVDPSEEVDMAWLRRRCLLLVRSAAPVFLLLCQLPWFLIMRSQDWPDKSAMDMNPGMLCAALVSTNLFYNVPDFVSIGIYVRMVFKFRSKASGDSNAVHPEDNHHQQHQLPDEESGGIWVGAPAEELEEVQSSKSGDGSSTSISDGGGSSDDDDNARSVLRFLRLHVCLCLLDVGVVLAASLHFRHPAAKVLSYVYQLGCCFLVPFATVKTGFRQLDGMAAFVGRAVCQVGGAEVAPSEDQEQE